MKYGKQSLSLITISALTIILAGCGATSQDQKKDSTSSSTPSAQSESSYDKQHHLKPFKQLTLNEYVQRLNGSGWTVTNNDGDITVMLSKKADTIAGEDITKDMTKTTSKNLNQRAEYSHDTINRIRYFDKENGQLVASSQNGTYQYIGFSKDNTKKVQKSSSSASNDTSSNNSSQQPSKPAEYALERGQKYVEMSGFSKKGLYQQLTDKSGDGFDKDSAQYAIDNVHADWNQQALKAAKQYQKMAHMSNSNLTDQLQFDGFNDSQIQYAINNSQ